MWISPVTPLWCTSPPLITRALLSHHWQMNRTYLRCKMRWFDTRIHCEVINTNKLINTSSPRIITCFVCVVRTLKVQPFGKSQEHNTVSSALTSTLHGRPPGAVIHPVTESLSPWPAPPYFAPHRPCQPPFCFLLWGFWRFKFLCIRKFI